MSTNLNCLTYEVTATEWYLQLDEPTGTLLYGPFENEDLAIDYLNDNFANPGGWSTIRSRHINAVKRTYLRQNARPYRPVSKWSSNY